MLECWLNERLSLSLQWYFMGVNGFERWSYALPTFETADVMLKVETQHGQPIHRFGNAQANPIRCAAT